MSTRKRLQINSLALLPILLFGWPLLATAQVPVDENGDPVGEYESFEGAPATGKTHLLQAVC